MWLRVACVALAAAATAEEPLAVVPAFEEVAASFSMSSLTSSGAAFGAAEVVSAGQTATLARTTAKGELFTLTKLTSESTTTGAARPKGIPAGRSYDGEAWEAVEPLLLSYTCGDTSCDVVLPEEADVEYRLDSYVARTLDAEDDAWRLLLQGTLGPSRGAIDEAASIDATAWVVAEMAKPTTLHRSYYRERANQKLRQSYPGFATTEPCDVGSRWNRFAFNIEDTGHALTIEASDGVSSLFVDGVLRTQVTTFIPPTTEGPAWNICFVDESLNGLIHLGTECDLGYFARESASRPDAESMPGGFIENVAVEFLTTTPEAAVAVLSELNPIVKGNKIATGFASCDLGPIGARFAVDEAGDYYVFDQRLHFIDNTASSTKRDSTGWCNAVPKTFKNAGTCEVSPECSPPAFESLSVTLDHATLRDFYEKEGLFVFKVEGMQDDYIDEVCADKTHWVKLSDSECAEERWAGSAKTKSDFQTAISARLDSLDEAARSTKVVVDLTWDEVDADGDDECDAGGQTKSRISVPVEKATSTSPTTTPTLQPSMVVESDDGMTPSLQPSMTPTFQPSMPAPPTAALTAGPTAGPTAAPTAAPSMAPSMTPSLQPSGVPAPSPTKEKEEEEEEKKKKKKKKCKKKKKKSKKCKKKKCSTRKAIKGRCCTKRMVRKGECDLRRLADTGDRRLEDSGGSYECWEQSHEDTWAVYDMSKWVVIHPGNSREFRDHRKNPIADFASDEGTTLRYPGWHPAGRWEWSRREFTKIGNFGDVVDFARLPSEVRRSKVAAHFGAVQKGHEDPAFEMCYDEGEVGTDPAKGFYYAAFMQADKETSLTDFDIYADGGVRGLWFSASLKAEDQLRQRVAWALSQIYVVADDDNQYMEALSSFYDIFVRGSTGNFKTMLKEVAFSPLMGEYLTFEGSKSMAHSYERTGMTLFPDENFARELMQLFTVGLWRLNEDGTQREEPTYDQNDITEFARTWTGFERQDERGNTAAIWSVQWPENPIDPMRLGEGRDAFPKLGLQGEGQRTYIGEGETSCASVNSKEWLSAGARWEYLGWNPQPRLLSPQPSWWTDENHVRKLLVLNPESSELYAALCDPDEEGVCRFQSEVVLPSDLACDGECPARSYASEYGNPTKETSCECSVDSPRIVRVDDAPAEHGNNGHHHARRNVYYEYVAPKCVDRLFADDPADLKAIIGGDGGGMCAFKGKADAGTACCSQDDHGEDVVVEGTYCLFVGELVNFATAESRCESMGYKVCTESLAGRNHYCGADMDNWFHWLDAACEQKAQVDGSGRVALISEFGGEPVRKVAVGSGHYFNAVWDGGYPKAPDCGTGCEVHESTCVCSVTVAGSVVIVGGFQFVNPPIYNSLVQPAPRDAYYETEAVIEHFATHPNTAPFVSKALIQKLTTSNPSPRYVKAVATAFKEGTYTSSGTTFGSGDYGDMDAIVAAIFLDREARSSTLDLDPTHGSLRDPLLKVTHLMRALELGFTKEREISLTSELREHIGVDPHNAPSVFSFYLPGFAPPSGPVSEAGLVAPEAMLLSGPKLMGYLNGAGSLVKNGIAYCDDGLGGWVEGAAIKTEREDPVWVSCRGTLLLETPEDGERGLSFRNTLRFVPECWGGSTNVNRCTASEVVTEIEALLVKKGGLSAENREHIVQAYAQAAGYKFNDKWMTWAEAKRTCESRGARLPTPCSAEENEALRLNLLTEEKSLWSIWLGVNDRLTEGEYTFCNEYSNWDDWEPNNWGEFGEDCVELGMHDDGSGKWNDLPCNRTSTFVCEGDDLGALELALQLFAIAPEFQVTNELQTALDAQGEVVVREDYNLTANKTIDLEDYKAIVYIFMDGGADSYSTLVPYDGCSGDLDEQYYTVRANIAIAKSGLLPVDVPSEDEQPCSRFGVHSSLPLVRDMFEEGEASFIANVGVMIEPILDKEAFDSNSFDIPRSLFAHNTQQELTQAVYAQDASAGGVLGRMGDAITLNSSGLVFEGYSIDGNAAKVLEGIPGLRRAADVISSTGVQTLEGDNRMLEDHLTILTSNVAESFFAETYAAATHEALARSEMLAKTVEDRELMACATAAGNLGDQLSQVARIVEAAEEIGANRQVFYAEIGGFDTHGDTGGTLAEKYVQLNAAIECFKTEMEAQGRWKDVVLVTASEFARTMTSNGLGTDHAWGGVHFIAGGSLKGGHILGEFPSDITDDSPLSLGQGRLIPTTPWEALWNGIAEWFGVPEEDLPSVVPHAANFDDSIIFSKDELFDGD